ncbi:MAG: hypothetical protein MJZ74_04315 [Muribaculaceae bacterium]|nr:hypothetical protein [Muribaculaceae bacterium]
MKRQLISSLIALAVVTLSSSASACTSSQEVPQAETPATNPSIAKTDTVQSFRFELFKGGESAVYYYTADQQHNYGNFYTRDMGSSSGWNYTVTTEYMEAFSKLARDLKLNKYPYTELNDEDTSRDRWNIEVTFTNGKHVSIVNYLTEANKAKDEKISDKAVAAFKAIAIKDKDGNMLGEYTETRYIGGKRTKEIYYTRDGIVRGGQDFSLPKDAPPAEYGVPQAPGKLY